MLRPDSPLAAARALRERVVRSRLSLRAVQVTVGAVSPSLRESERLIVSRKLRSGARRSVTRQPTSLPFRTFQARIGRCASEG